MTDPAHELLEALDNATTRWTEIAAQLRGLTLNGVMRSETLKLDADGRAHRNFSAPYAAVGLWAYDSEITASSGPVQQLAPTDGIGVIYLPAQRAIVWPLAGTELSIYGTEGARVLVTLFSTPQVPSIGGTSSGVDGGGAP
jgi:hypothetical protein